MATGMNLERLSVALLLSLVASLCYPGAESSHASDGPRRYTQYCQACHMPDGKGATGAGTYPALASNPNLKMAAYPITVVMYGKAGMPWFNGLLTPEEIAAVVGYVRTNFGNNYAEPVTTEEVAKLRGPIPTE